MKLYVGIAVGLLLGSGLMLLVPHGTPQVVYAGGTPSGNGDVNASGDIDIADAIYLLMYLFAKGPEPEPIVCPPPSLPATGQKDCYDLRGAPVAWDDPGTPGQDGFYQSGCPSANRFVDNQDGTVTDTCTGLMWQQETAPGVYWWGKALRYCEDLTLAGHSDWRLPNVRELQSIVDYGRRGLSIDPVFGAESESYWSSSTSVVSPSGAWFVCFYDGAVSDTDKILVDDYVRAVRDAQ